MVKDSMDVLELLRKRGIDGNWAFYGGLRLVSNWIMDVDVSARRVDDLVKALGSVGISKSQVSRICGELDRVVDSFLERPFDGGPYCYLWLDALSQKASEEGRIVNVSVVVATAVNAEGKRDIVGMDMGTSEDGAFWLSFLRSHVARGMSGMSGVELVTSVSANAKMSKIAKFELTHP